MLVILLAISIHFLSGAYHATPWGKHVNEGIPEWPPSSWRLLRAIIATWKHTLPDLEDEAVWPILRRLAEELPHYNLPDASVSHTRHYMPTNKEDALVINTFVVVGSKPVEVIWDNVSLDAKEIEILGTVLKNLHYLGRAESWCSVSISDGAQNCNCSPMDEDSIGRRVEETELVRVLAPTSDVGFVDHNMPEGKDADLESITVTTKQLQENKFIDPPGARWIWYTRPQNCFATKSSSRIRSTITEHVTLVRYAVVGTIRPDIRDTLRVGNLARSACMSRYGKWNRSKNSLTFSGKDSGGRPLVGHKHAFYLPTYEEQNRRIDHLTIIASGSFSKNELDVLFSLKKLYRYNMTDVNLLFQASGTIDDFDKIPILTTSKTWVSATPLVLSRHIKYRGRTTGNMRIVDGPEEQIRTELMNKYPGCLIENITADSSPTNINNTTVKPFEFHRRRSHGSVGDGRAYKVRLEFSEHIKGPITLGYASHFGLGMFVPEDG